MKETKTKFHREIHQTTQNIKKYSDSFHLSAAKVDVDGGAEYSLLEDNFKYSTLENNFNYYMQCGAIMSGCRIQIRNHCLLISLLIDLYTLMDDLEIDVIFI